jgi:acylphosphatase
LKLARAHLIIKGVVQGVSFRHHTKLKAQFLGLTGWVRNLETGEVEAVFEGPEDKVKDMVEWCKKGPMHAKVENIEIKVENHKGEFKRFERI